MQAFPPSFRVKQRLATVELGKTEQGKEPREFDLRRLAQVEQEPATALLIMQAETVRLIDQIRNGQLERTTTTAAWRAQAESGALPKPVRLPLASTGANAARPRVTLPAEVTGFVGREREILQVQQRLADPTCRLVTITGMGGVGKTRLAVRIAHLLANRLANEQTRQFPDGIHFAPLAALEAHPQLEHLLATTLAAALRIPLTGEATPTSQLLQALAEQELLLILDNCEHLPVAPFINQLLQQTQ